jgi:hypothetical protein
MIAADSEPPLIHADPDHAPQLAVLTDRILRVPDGIENGFRTDQEVAFRFGRHNGAGGA